MLLTASNSPTAGLLALRCPGEKHSCVLLVKYLKRMAEFINSEKEVTRPG
jgi:hypothetical protein